MVYSVGPLTRVIKGGHVKDENSNLEKLEKNYIPQSSTGGGADRNGNKAYHKSVA